jgi:hypothetical protein
LLLTSRSTNDHATRHLLTLSQLTLLSCGCGCFVCTSRLAGRVLASVFGFGLWFGVCLVVVVGVGAVFDVGCGCLWICCGWQKASFRVDIYARGISARNRSGTISTVRVSVEQKVFHATSMSTCVIKFKKSKYQKLFNEFCWLTLKAFLAD